VGRRRDQARAEEASRAAIDGEKPACHDEFGRDAPLGGMELTRSHEGPRGIGEWRCDQNAPSLDRHCAVPTLSCNAQTSTPGSLIMRNLLSIPEFCVYWNTSRASVFRQLKRGLPSVIAIGIGRRILRAQADAWLEAGGGKRMRRRHHRPSR
jgi:hypothetical protein